MVKHARTVYDVAVSHVAPGVVLSYARKWPGVEMVDRVGDRMTIRCRDAWISVEIQNMVRQVGGKVIEVRLVEERSAP